LAASIFQHLHSRLDQSFRPLAIRRFRSVNYFQR
jgi:hypothetical protein